MSVKRSLLFIIVSASLSWGQTADVPEIVNKVASAAGNWLKMDADVRAIGMGGTNVAIGYGVSAIPKNPSLIAFIPRSQVYYSKTSYLAGISLNNFGLGRKVGHSDFVGIHLFYLDSGPIEITDVANPEGTGENYHTRFISARTVYARRLTDRLKVGVTLNFIHEAIATAYKNTFAFDVGSNFNTGLYGFILGMSVANFGPETRYGGKALATDVSTDLDVGGSLDKITAKYPLPLSFRLGVANTIIGPEGSFFKNSAHRITVSAEGISPIDFLVSGSTGLEYGWNEMVFARLGSKLGHDSGGMAGGAGIKYRADRFIVTVDYAVASYGILDLTQQLGIGLEF